MSVWTREHQNRGLSEASHRISSAGLKQEDDSPQSDPRERLFVGIDCTVCQSDCDSGYGEQQNVKQKKQKWQQMGNSEG